MDPTETCASCQKPLSDPKTLPCLHSFCSSCIQDLVANSQQKSHKKLKNLQGEPISHGLCCPRCSTAFELPAGGVSALPVGLFGLGVIRQIPSNVKCGFCEVELAIVHCTSCNVFIGEQCLMVHSRSKLTAAHVVVNVDDYFNELEPTRVLFCQHHPALEIDTFCQTDDQPMCVACVVPGHVSHQVVKLKDISLDFSAEITKALQPVRLSFLLLLEISLNSSMK